MTPETRARLKIDKLLADAGWHMCDFKAADIHAARGVAIREFVLEPGHGIADYLLYIDGKAAGVVEAKRRGATLLGAERQSDRYSKGLAKSLPAWSRALPFAYQSTGIETRFTNGLDPELRSRNVFAFHRPEFLSQLLEAAPDGIRDNDAPPNYSPKSESFLARLQKMAPLVTEWVDFQLWPAQIKALQSLELSLAQNKPRTLIQMATAISFIYRLIKFAGAWRVLFLVDRGNEFAQKITYRTTRNMVRPIA